MKKIGIVTDEVGDIDKEIARKHKIAIASAKMDWPDIENLPGENTFQKMREVEKRGIESFGKTSQPSPKNFLDCYKEQFKYFDEIICITVTSKLSGTFNSAIQARNMLGPEKSDKILVVDSLNATAGQALVVLKAVDSIEESKDSKEVAEELQGLIPKVRFFGILPDPKWLEKSGRMSSNLANWVRKMAGIGIRPLIGIKSGVVKAVGVRTRVKDVPTALFKELEDQTKKSRKQGKRIRVVITHGDDIKEAEKLKKMIEEGLENTEVAFLNLIDNVLGIITGPGTLFCAWCEK
ncbi:MAG: DegV family protein [Candidatus Pacebacteria bacterium]|nr:DegV family protein [Candidatus Paceibacterota bacterium]